MNALLTSKSGRAATAMVVCAGLLLIGLRMHLVPNPRPYYQAAATLSSEIKAAKREGLPMSPADLVRPNPVPDAQNAALLYSQIRGVTVSPKDDASLSAVVKGEATDADRIATRQLLTTAAPQLQLAAQAFILPDCDFHRDWSLVRSGIPPEFTPMLQTGRLLAAQAMLQSEVGHPEAALRTIQVGAHMAQHVGKEPTVVAFLIRISLEDTVGNALQNVIRNYADRPDILRLAERTEQEFGPMPDIKYALGGEVVRARTVVDMLRKQKDLSSLDSNYRTPFTGAPLSVMADAYEAHSLAFWRRIFAAVNRTPGDPMATYNAFKAVLVAEERAFQSGNGQGQLAFELQGGLNLCPFFSEADKEVVHTEALRRLRRTLVTLLVYRRQKGHLPATLALLSPVAPSDPYNYKSLHYRRTEKGFLLYSVGANLTDDGGNPRSIRGDHDPFDVVTTFP